MHFDIHQVKLLFRLNLLIFRNQRETYDLGDQKVLCNKLNTKLAMIYSEQVCKDYLKE